MHDMVDQEFRSRVFYLLKEQTETIIKLEETVNKLVEATNNAMMRLREDHDRLAILEAQPAFHISDEDTKALRIMDDLTEAVVSRVNEVEAKLGTLEDHVRAIDERSGPKSMRSFDVLERVRQFEEEQWKGFE